MRFESTAKVPAQCNLRTIESQSVMHLTYASLSIEGARGPAPAAREGAVQPDNVALTPGQLDTSCRCYCGSSSCQASAVGNQQIAVTVWASISPLQRWLHRSRRS